MTHEEQVAAVTAAFFVNAAAVAEAFLTERPLPILELKNGFRIFHGPDDAVADLFHEIFVLQAYTKGFYTPRPDDVVVDCGANIGLFALFMCASAPGVRVHCFEPMPVNLRRLAENVHANGLERSVVIHPYAVLDGAGRRPLSAGRRNGQWSFFHDDREPAAEHDAACVSLAEALALCGAPRIDLLKLDVEGAEIEILEGANDVTWDRIGRVALEYHDLMRDGCRDRACAALTRYGFGCEVTPGPGDGLGLIRARPDAPRDASNTPGRV